MHEIGGTPCRHGMSLLDACNILTKLHMSRRAVPCRPNWCNMRVRRPRNRQGEQQTTKHIERVVLDHSRSQMNDCPDKGPMIFGMVQWNVGLNCLLSDPVGSVSNPAEGPVGRARSRIVADLISRWAKRKHRPLGPEKPSIKCELRGLVWAAGTIGIPIPIDCATNSSVCRRVHQLGAVVTIANGRQASGTV